MVEAQAIAEQGVQNSMHFERGLLLSDFNRFDLSAAELRAAMVDDPADPGAPIMLALTLLALGQEEEAESVGREAVRRAPDMALTHVALGWVYGATGQFDAAIRCGREAMRIEPQGIQGCLLLARLSLDQERWEDALKDADNVLAREPLNTLAVSARSRALIGMGRANEAVKELHLALQREPEDSELHTVLGQALLCTRQESEALSHFKESLRLAPDSDESRRFFMLAIWSRNPLYRSFLRGALWLSHRNRQCTTLRLVPFLLYMITAIALVGSWHPSIAWFTAGLTICTAILFWESLAFVLFDLALMLDPVGREIHVGAERSGLQAVGGGAAIAGAGIIGAIFHPALLLFSVPTATVISLLLYAVIASPRKDGKRMQSIVLLPTIGAVEISLFFWAMSIAGFEVGRAAVLMLAAAFIWFWSVMVLWALFTEGDHGAPGEKEHEE